MRSELAPGFLIAAPSMNDQSFDDSVVLLVESNEAGAMGFVINRTLDITIGELAEELKIDVDPTHAAFPVYGGGPVHPERGWVLARRLETTPPDLEVALELPNSVVVITAIDALKALLATPNQCFRLMLGYAGWGPAQLEGELKQGAWLPLGFRSQLLFETEPDAAFKDALEALGLGPSFLWGKGGQGGMN